MRRRAGLRAPSAVAALWPLLLALNPSVARAQAQEPTTVSDTADRPGFADSAYVIGRGRVQIESGIEFDDQRSGQFLDHVTTWPQLQLRFGLSRRIDASVWWDGLVHLSTADPMEQAGTGGADPRVGAKVQLVDREAIALAVVASIGLPVGSDLVSAGELDPLVRLCWSTPVTSSFDLSGTVDVAEDRRDGLRRPRPAISAALGHAFGASVGGFLGLIAEDGDEGSGLHILSAEAGLTRAFGPRRQVDITGGRRLAGGLMSWFIGGGFVQRVR